MRFTRFAQRHTFWPRRQWGNAKDDWAIDLLGLAYVNEYGLETEEQSCLNLVDLIGIELCEPFKIFGESDEKYRIKGGSSALINALVSALQGKVEMKKNFALTARLIIRTARLLRASTRLEVSRVHEASMP